MRLTIFAALVAVLVAGCSFVPSDMVDTLQNASSAQNATDSVSQELVERTIQGLEQAKVRSDGTADIGLGDRAQFDIAYQPLKRAQNKELVRRGDRYVLSEKRAQRGTRASTQAASSPYEVLVYRKEMYGTEALEYELVLNEQPNTTSFVFDLNTSNLDLYYQPPLHEELGNGMVNETCNATDCGDSHRPAHVVGSYAAYYQDTTRNGETGKAFHIYRPWLNDSNGNKAWADLRIENGTATITPPAGYLDKAAYPVVVDPTIGYTGAGSSWNNLGVAGRFGLEEANNLGFNNSLSETADIKNVSAYLRHTIVGTSCGTGPLNWSAVIWDGDSGSQLDNTSKTLTVSTSASWNTINWNSQASVSASTTAVMAGGEGCYNFCGPFGCTSDRNYIEIAYDSSSANGLGCPVADGSGNACALNAVNDPLTTDPNIYDDTDDFTVTPQQNTNAYSLYYTYEGGAPSDSCSPDGASTHTYECTDACNITSGIDFGANDVTFNGSGTVRIDGVSLNTSGDVRIQNSCTVRLENGGSIK